LQAYSFRDLTFVETLDHAQALGIHYLQAYPRQKLGGDLPGEFQTMDAATQQKVLGLLKTKGITLMSFGVVRGSDEAQWRRHFELAKAMGMHDIAAEPVPEKWNEMVPLLDRLANEYGISVAIHNHPNPDLAPAKLLAALRNISSRVGLCADTGHWARSGFEPIAALREARGRVISLHLKDLKKFARDGVDVPWGTGVLDVAGQIAELQRQNFSGVAYIEYEHATTNRDRELAQCVEFFAKTQRSPIGK
jgi:sugar phosphate isomerase/epimerase